MRLRSRLCRPEPLRPTPLQDPRPPRPPTELPALWPPTSTPRLRNGHKPRRTMASSLASPTYNNGERCQITMLPLRPSSQPLAQDAIGRIPRASSSHRSSSPPTQALHPQLSHGLSPEGWEYFSIRKLVGGQGGEARDPRHHPLCSHKLRRSGGRPSSPSPRTSWSASASVFSPVTCGRHSSSPSTSQRRATNPAGSRHNPPETRRNLEHRHRIRRPALHLSRQWPLPGRLSHASHSAKHHHDNRLLRRIGSWSLQGNTIVLHPATTTAAPQNSSASSS